LICPTCQVLAQSVLTGDRLLLCMGLFSIFLVGSQSGAILFVRPRATILRASSGNGRCNALASSHGARIQTSAFFLRRQDHRHRLRKQPGGQISKSVSSPDTENISLPGLVETALWIPIVPPHKGRIAIVTRQRFARDGIAGRVERLVSDQQRADERCCSVRPLLGESFMHSSGASRRGIERAHVVSSLKPEK